MQQTLAARAPMHLWIVGGLSLLWNAFGCLDYFMTRTRGAEWIKAAMADVDANAYMAYINDFPIWASIGWGLGVWGALAGSIFLLTRSRWAVAAFGISLLGAVLGMGYQLMNPAKVSGLDPTMNAVMPFVIIIVALALFLYARAMRARGVLR